MSSPTTILPPRPLRLTSGTSVKTLAAMIALFVTALGLVAGAVYASTGLFTLLNDVEKFDEWPEAKSTSVVFEVEYNRFTEHWEFDVSYVTNDDRAYEGLVEISTYFVDLSKDGDPAVHYDPASPDRFVLNWTVESTTGRWLAQLSTTGGLLFLAACLALWGGWMGSDLRTRRSLARRSMEVFATVVSTKSEGATEHADNVEYTYTLPGSDRTYKKTINIASELPLAMDWEGDCIVVLAAPTNPKRHVLVMSDFTPFELSQAEENECLARMRTYRDEHFPRA